MAARFSDPTSPAASLPMRLPSSAFGIVVILSAISREVVLKPQGVVVAVGDSVV